MIPYAPAFFLTIILLTHNLDQYFFPLLSPVYKAHSVLYALLPIKQAVLSLPFHTTNRPGKQGYLSETWFSREETQSHQ